MTFFYLFFKKCLIALKKSADKWSIMDPSRGFFDKLFGHYLGKERVDRWGNVTLYKAEEGRKKVNNRLQQILKNSTLSGDEKKTKMREVVAQYRDESRYHRAPNKKVGEALEKYLQPKKKEGR